jgi:hypothetical protein
MTEAPPRVSASGEYGLPVNRSITLCIRAFVDGDFLRYLNACDAEEGWLEVTRHDDNGLPVHLDGEWMTRRICGKVHVILLPENGPTA